MLAHGTDGRGGLVQDVHQGDETIRALLNARADSALLLDAQGTILVANETCAKRIGIAAEKLCGTHIFDYFEPAVAEARREKLRESVRTGKPVRFLDERGGLWFDNNVVPVQGPDGRVQRVAVFATDITERKRAEEALIASEAKYRNLVTVMKEGLMAVDRNDVIHFVNPKVCELLGYAAEEIVGRSVATFLADAESRARLEEKSRLRSEGVSDSYELAMLTRSGRVVHVLVSGTPVTDETGEVVGSMGVLTDITERKRAEEKIRAALTEKTVLLKEIHHRVKNNLQVISSLLNLQSSGITDTRMRELFTESQNRIRSMALVHEQLYRARDLSSIDCAEYLKNLATNLFRSYGGETRGIQLRVEATGMTVGVDAAIPCGLIVNELVSNALKHGFASRSGNGTPPEVTVRFARREGETLELSVSDNGRGFPEDLDFRSAGSLGLQLVNVLAEQLEGSVSLDRSCGTQFAVRFPS
jgi:hypothetical protein